MKKSLAALLTLVLAVSLASPAFAATKKHKKHGKKHHAAAKHHAKKAPAAPATAPAK